MMQRPVLVKKQSGEQEPFDNNKLLRSLQRSGASQQLALEIAESLQHIIHEGITTGEIYQKAFSLLRQKMRPVAARFSLKKAIMELGPTGFPFEQFVAQVLRQKGFEVQTGQFIRGRCVVHEVDVVATHDHSQFMVECKFHNQQGKVCNVKVPLYIHSRFQDIEFIWRDQPGNHSKTYQGWVVTNTRFTSDAIEYGRCAGLHLVGWDYPEKGSLRQMIEESGLFPVTALTHLSLKQKQQLLEQGIVLCQQLINNPGALDFLDLSKGKILNILREAAALAY